ncbi:MAG TPA: hypothetical protein PK020_22240 [Ilumatobacteraceae bacterium]|nr:hypothetical protein [Ilumatobacteraceae bacterium]
MKALIAIASVLAVAGSGSLVPPTVLADDGPTTPAWFEDHWIDLAVDWEDATACSVTPEAAECFRTEAEMDEALAADRSSVVVPLAACASSLRLYDGASYGGTTISLSARLTYLNLSAYSFDNLTSSYRVGACDVDLFANASGAGGVYPGATTANSQSPSMTSGWNNVIPSVYIY